MLRIPTALVTLAAAFGVHAQEFDPADIEGRIEYAFYTADANALRTLVSATTSALAKGGNTPLANYQVGLAQYRLGQVLTDKKDSKAAAAMSGCIDALDEAIEADKQFAEAYALQGACYTNLAGLRAWKAVVDTPLGTNRMEKALKLAPENPRVVLLDALSDFERPSVLGGDKARACTKFQRAVQLFDAGTETVAGPPSWGAADAYLYVGRCLSAKGDVLGARNALERALIVAPDFAAARLELRRVTTTRS